jgi:hypothetical protein
MRCQEENPTGTQGEKTLLIKKRAGRRPALQRHEKNEMTRVTGDDKRSMR